MEEYNLIDLGLPSGTLWMDRNIGASSPEDAGLYFAWGETQGYTADEVGETKQFSWSDYKYIISTNDKLTKYCLDDSLFNKGYIDGLITLEAMDDGVMENTSTCSTPTKAQIQELVDNTTYEWTTKDGVNGGLFTSKANGNSIFVPAVAFCGNGYEYGFGYEGNLWSSSLDEDNNYCAWCLSFDDSCSYIDNHSRHVGLNVRGVFIKLSK